ncbi:hypothetical protein F5B20DRAFT_540215 [Whalleya microplaca]|nr:hypothetical protein F5B20DRAFT_540215 [Whalleya microplaca]
MTTSLFIAILIAGVPVQGEESAFQTCYFRDGSVSMTSFRCNNATAGHSSCCLPNSLCWSNGVCQINDGGIEDWTREGCTDHSWNDSACFSQCSQYAPFGTTGVRPCDGIDKSNRYCCADKYGEVGSFECCTNTSSIFTYGGMNALPTVVGAMLDSAGEVPITSTIEVQVPSMSSTFIMPGSSTLSAIARPSSFPDKDERDDGSGSLPIAIGISLGVGLPAAAAIIGGIWWAMWRSNKKHAKQREDGIQKQQWQYSNIFANLHNKHALASFALTEPAEMNSMREPQELHGRSERG